MSKTSSVIIVVGIVVLAVLGLWVLSGGQKGKMSDSKTNSAANSQNQQAPQIQEVKVTDVKKEQVPSDYFKGFPMETGAEVLTNNTSASAEGTQSTRKFVSKKTLADNYKLYTNYLKTNGWTIKGTITSPCLSPF